MDLRERKTSRNAYPAIIKEGANAMKKKSKAVRYNKWGYIFLIPFIIVYVIFQLIPMVTTIYNSFL